MLIDTLINVQTHRSGGGYIAISRPTSLISSSESFNHTRETNTQNYAPSSNHLSSSRSLLSEQTNITIQNNVQNISDTRTIETRFSAEYSRTSYVGQSAAQAALVEKYNILRTNPTSNASFKVSFNGQERTMTVTEDYVRLANGKSYSLSGNELVNAIENNQISFDGDLSVNVSTVKSFSYIDENGEQQTQQGFSIVEYSYKDEKGKVYYGEYAIDNSKHDTEATNIEGEGTITVEEKYEASNEISKEMVEEHYYSIFTTIPDGPTPMEIKQKYMEQQRYLFIVQNTTNGQSISV